MPNFVAILIAQIASLVGTQLTGFGLGVWVFQRTGSTTLYGFVTAAVLIPRFLLSPLVGVWIDSCDRRKILMGVHAGAGLCSFGLVIFCILGLLNVWIIIAFSALASLCYAADRPVFAAITTALIPKAQLGRANGMFELGVGISMIVGPALAGFLFGRFGLGVILIVDIATFMLAMIVLASVRIPSVAIESRKFMTGSIVQEARYAWCYLRSQTGLVALLILFAVYNFLAGLAVVLFTPLVLGFADVQELGGVLAFGGLGMLAGGGLIAIWGGPKRPMEGVFGFMLVSGLVLLLGAYQPSLKLVSIAAFLFLFATPVVASCNQTIWQRTVMPDLQGRVFGLKEALSTLPLPIAYLAAGPLVDWVFEPMMASDGLLRDSLGIVIGVGLGRGVALVFCLAGTLMIIMVLFAYLFLLRHLRNEQSVEHVEFPNIALWTVGNAGKKPVKDMNQAHSMKES